jgi:hypothetical protein
MASGSISNIEKNLNIEVYEYLLDKYPVGPHVLNAYTKDGRPLGEIDKSDPKNEKFIPYNYDVRSISVDTSEDEDCNKFETEFDSNIHPSYLGHNYMGIYMIPDDYKNSLNTRVCDPIHGKLLVTHEKNPISAIPFIDITTNPKAYSELNFKLDGIELVDIMKFLGRFGARRNKDLSSAELLEGGIIGTMGSIYNKDIIMPKIEEIKTMLSSFWIDNANPGFSVDSASSTSNTLVRIIRNKIQKIKNYG